MAEAKPVKGPMGRPPRGVKPQVENPGKIFVRIMKYVLKNYTPHCIIAVVSIFVSVLANVQGTMFMKTLIDSYIMPMLKASDPDFTPLLHAILRCGSLLSHRYSGYVCPEPCDDLCDPGNLEKPEKRSVCSHGKTADQIF